MLYGDLTEKIIGCAFLVFNRMGFGFLESVYQKCMLIELAKSKLNVRARSPICVRYSGQPVGEFVADFLVEDAVIVELKSVRAIQAAHEAQLVNYLTATGKEIGLLINFGQEGVEVKRKYRTPKRQDQQD